MASASQVNRRTKGGSLRRAVEHVTLAALVGLLLGLPSAAQIHGVPPSVTSIGGHYLPNARPSVTSLGPYGYGHKPYTGIYPTWPYNGYYRGRTRGYGYGYGGLTYAVPYYVPFDASYGYDYVGGPDLYSGPPVGPNDPVLHIVVEQPSAKAYAEDQEAPPRQEQSTPIEDAKPNEPTVLIFRDGHKLEVANYAIMGQTVYIFDKRTQKVALTDLDVPATVKANDERGLDFKVPAAMRAPQKKNSGLQPKSAPDQSTSTPSDIASIVP